MANDVTKILAATSGGYAYVAPVGTTAPTTAEDTLDGAFVNLGEVSEDGLSEAPNTATTEVRNWSGTSVKTLITETTYTFSFTLLQTDGPVLELYHGGATVESDGGTGSKIVVEKAATDRRSFVFDVNDGDDIVRIYVPVGEVTERGEITYTAGGVASYNVTVTAYPDESGEIIEKFYSKDLVTGS